MFKRNTIDKLILLYCFILTLFLLYTCLNFRKVEVNESVVLKLRYWPKSVGSNGVSEKEKNQQPIPGKALPEEFVTPVTDEDSFPLEIVADPQVGYVSLVKDSERLGEAIGVEFQKCPISWVNISFTNPDNVVEAASLGGVQPKKILLYERFSWFNPQNPNITCADVPRFPCEFHEYQFPEAALYDEQSMTDTARGYDAIVIPRDFAHGQPVGVRSTEMENLTRIFYTLESPFATYFKIPLDIRDYLASYWRGSDIYTPYFKWQPKKSEGVETNQGKNYAEGKTKMAAIVVSNCFAVNNRQGFVDTLKKYIDVDVYGHCGDKDYCPANGNCFDKLKKDYKFYLAFENCNCRDYITEKFYFNALQHEMIPVVMGAHPSDYKTVAPENSYIHVEDFNSVKELADYMKLLDSNDTLYNEYFTWKGTGTFGNANSPCEICTFLHLHEFYVNDDTKYPKSYLNSEDEFEEKQFYWSGDVKKMCLPHDQWYWNP